MSMLKSYGQILQHFLLIGASLDTRQVDAIVSSSHCYYSYIQICKHGGSVRVQACPTIIKSKSPKVLCVEGPSPTSSVQGYATHCITVSTEFERVWL